MQLNDKGLLFSHIPKTAGTSLRLSVQRHVKSWKVYSDYDADNPTTSRIIRKFYETDDFSKISDLNGPKTLLAGHFPIKKYLPYYPINRVISFVRDPVQRVISHYHDLQRRHGYSESLETFITQRRFQNTQSRFFKGVPVEAVGFIGICEFYDESIEIINKLFCTTIPIKKFNTNKKKKEDFYVVPGEIAELIKESNKLDCELYDYALKIFLKRKELLISDKPFIYGKIDLRSADKIVGWAVNPDSADAVKLNLLVNDKIENTVIANNPVQDLIELNIANNSHVGFVFDLENKYTGNDSIKVIVDGVGQEID